MKTRIYLLILSIISVSCVASSDTGDHVHISLIADVKNLDISSKAGSVYPVAASPFEAISSSSPLEAKVLFSFNKSQFPDNPQEPYFIPCHTKVTFKDHNLTFVDYYPNGASIPQQLKYPTDGTDRTVYCAGFYPADGWTFENGSASYEIDGIKDVMFADVISGDWNTQLPVQNYRHMQSWVKVLASANTIEAATNWGSVTKISIETEKGFTITYPGASDASSTIAYSDGDLKYLDLFENTDGVPLSITFSEIGSAFLIPPASCELTVKVCTTVFPEGKYAKVKLYDLDNTLITDRSRTIGKLFVLNLNFTNLSVIEGVCTLNYWNDQDGDLYLQ